MTQIELTNKVLALHDSISKSTDDQKYLLRRDDGKSFVVSKAFAVQEMGSGCYTDWSGPFDEVSVISKKIETERYVRRAHIIPRERTHEEIMEQLQRVRRQFIRI